MRQPETLRRWLFRSPPDRQLPIELTQRRIYILPTGAGLLFAAALTVMLIGAINYNLGLGHALVFLLATIGLLAMVHTFRNLFALQLLPGRAEPVFAGETARFPLRLDNPGRLPRRAIELAFAGQAMVNADLPPSGSMTVRIPFVTQRRGRLDPGRLTLATRYPLGLLRAWSHPHPLWSCLVYPQAIHRPLPAATLQGVVDQLPGDSGQEDFAGLRQRQDSDPTRHIAWKAVARRTDEQPLLVKQFAGGAQTELQLDWSLTPQTAPPEARIATLAGWVMAAAAEDACYGLRLPVQEILPDSGNLHLNRCLEALALFPA